MLKLIIKNYVSIECHCYHLQTLLISLPLICGKLSQLAAQIEQDAILEEDQIRIYIFIALENEQVLNLMSCFEF